MNLARPSGSFLNLGVIRQATTMPNIITDTVIIMKVVLSIVTSVWWFFEIRRFYENTAFCLYVRLVSTICEQWCNSHSESQWFYLSTIDMVNRCALGTMKSEVPSWYASRFSVLWYSCYFSFVWRFWFHVAKLRITYQMQIILMNVLRKINGRLSII